MKSQRPRPIVPRKRQLKLKKPSSQKKRKQSRLMLSLPNLSQRRPNQRSLRKKNQRRKRKKTNLRIKKKKHSQLTKRSQTKRQMSQRTSRLLSPKRRHPRSQRADARTATRRRTLRPKLGASKNPNPRKKALTSKTLPSFSTNSSHLSRPKKNSTPSFLATSPS